MILLNTIVITLTLLPLFVGANFTHNHGNNHQQPSKSKRFLANQMYNQGEAKAVLFYMENPRQNGEVPELQTAASSTRNVYPAPGKPLAVVSVQQPIQVFEQDAPKQVAEQQVLYEFQQTPNNAVSNVQVKQLFQPDVTTSNPFYDNLDGEQLPTAQSFTSIQPQLASSLINNQPYVRSQPQALGSSHYPATSATIVSPVQHPNFYSPNQGLPSSTSFTNYPLFNSEQYSTIPLKQQQQTPGKYIYLNGKIVYNPAHHIIQSGKIIPPNSIYNKGVYHNQQKLPLINNQNNFAQNNNFAGQLQQQQQQQRPNNLQQQPGINIYKNRPKGHVTAQTQDKLAPNSYLPPVTKNNRFQPPKHLEQIDKPSAPVQQQQQEEESEDDEEDAKANSEETEDDVEEGEVEENDAEGKLETDEDEEDAHRGYGDDDSYGYETFQFEDEYLENDDAHFLKPPRNKAKRHRDEDELDAEDERSSTRKRPAKNNSRRYRNQPKYESGDNYGYYEGYSTNMKYKSPKSSKTKTKTKPIGKYKKVKFSRVKGGKPKVETIEGRFSEQVPVTHRQKLYKERWYVTQDVDGNKNKKNV